MRSFIEKLRWRLRHATVPLLLPGLLCLAAAIVGLALNVSGVNVPVLHGSARWFIGLVGVVLLGLSLVVGVEPPPPPPGGVQGALPELPTNHVVRPELLGRLRGALLDGTGSGPRRVGVWGMGGSGKSVLAAALVQDRAVRRRFPDGLTWERLEPPDDPAARPGMLAQRQRQLVAKLTPAGQVAGEVTDVEQGRNQLAELLRGRACLVVVDNVWTKDDVYAFDVLDQRGMLLVTTRNAGLVRAIGAAEVEVAELSDAQARTLAADWAKVPEQSLPPSAEETLRLVGNLALGVATVAAQARDDRQRWAELADRLHQADLAAFELRFPGYPYPSLLAALQLGLDYLDHPSDRQRYRELAVFAGRGAVPRPAIEALWAPAGVSATDAGDLLAKFSDRALLRRDPVTGSVELHDLQFDVARANLGDSLSAAHKQLLAGYAARCPRGWPSGPDDGYFYQHLAGHLAAAGRRDELAELLTDVEWMRSRLRAGE